MPKSGVCIKARRVLHLKPEPECGQSPALWGLCSIPAYPRIVDGPLLGWGRSTADCHQVKCWFLPENPLRPPRKNEPSQIHTPVTHPRSDDRAGCLQFPHPVPSTQDANLSSSLPISLNCSHHFIFKGQWFLFKVIIYLIYSFLRQCFTLSSRLSFSGTQYIKVKE